MVFPTEEKYKLQCEWGQCRETYEYMNDFYVHLDGHFWKDIAAVPRQPDSTLICQWCECNFVTANDHDLIRHLYFHGFHTKLKWLGYLKHEEAKSGECRIHQNRNIIPELPDGFKCCWEHCYIVVDIPDKYYDHVRDHALISDPEQLSNGKIGFKCHWEGCGYEYTLGSKTPSLGRHKLRGHLITHTQERCYACPWCGNLYVNKTKLIDHYTRQVDAEYHSFQCTHCSRTFASERILKDHMRHHVNHYQCPKCAMTSPNPSALKHHIRYKHSSERPYACEFCDYRSKEPHDLQTHMQFHQSDLSYQCQVADCDYAVRSLQNLRHHYRVKHGSGNGKYYACHLCDKKQGTGYQLTHHLRKKHNFHWPPGHCRFRYKECEDGMFRLQIFRYESIELTKQITLDETLTAEMDKNEASSTSALIKPNASAPAKSAKPIPPRMNAQRQKKSEKKGRKTPSIATRRSNRQLKNASSLVKDKVPNGEMVAPTPEVSSSELIATPLPDLYMDCEYLEVGQQQPITPEVTVKKRSAKKKDAMPYIELVDVQVHLSAQDIENANKYSSPGASCSKNSAVSQEKSSGATTKSGSNKKSTPSRGRFSKARKRLQLTSPHNCDSPSSKRPHLNGFDLIKECSVDVSPLPSPVFPNHHEIYCIDNLIDSGNLNKGEELKTGTSGVPIFKESSETPTPACVTPERSHTSITTLKTPIPREYNNPEDGSAMPQFCPSETPDEDRGESSAHPDSRSKLVEVNKSKVVTDLQGNRTVVNVGEEEFYLVTGMDKDSGSSVYCLVKKSEYVEE